MSPTRRAARLRQELGSPSCEPHRRLRGRRAGAAARMAATPAAPARMQSPAFVASTPPMATTGTSTARAMAASPSEPCRRVGVLLGRRRPRALAPMYAAPPPRRRPRRPTRPTGRGATTLERPLGACIARPRWTPSAPSSRAASTSSFTTDVARARRARPTSTTRIVVARLRRSWTTSRAVVHRRSPSGSSTSACTHGLALRDTGAASSLPGSSAASAS